MTRKKDFRFKKHYLKNLKMDIRDFNLKFGDCMFLARNKKKRNHE